jgi:hypothetical protein
VKVSQKDANLAVRRDFSHHFFSFPLFPILELSLLEGIFTTSPLFCTQAKKLRRLLSSPKPFRHSDLMHLVLGRSGWHYSCAIAGRGLKFIKRRPHHLILVINHETAVQYMYHVNYLDKNLNRYIVSAHGRSDEDDIDLRTLLPNRNWGVGDPIFIHPSRFNLVKCFGMRAFVIADAIYHQDDPSQSIVFKIMVRSSRSADPFCLEKRQEMF